MRLTVDVMETAIPDPSTIDVWLCQRVRYPRESLFDSGDVPCRGLRECHTLAGSILGDESYAEVP